jgi:hypothetical protein
MGHKWAMKKPPAIFDIFWMFVHGVLPSGKLTVRYGKSQFSMRKFTISIVIFNSYFDRTRGYRQCMAVAKKGKFFRDPLNSGDQRKNRFLERPNFTIWLVIYPAW